MEQPSTSSPEPSSQGHIRQAIAWLEQLQAGALQLADRPSADQPPLLNAIGRLAEHWQRQQQQRRLLDAITSNINLGLTLDDVLNRMYNDLRGSIPYDRIGFSLIEPDSQNVRARWARAEYADIHLGIGYTAPLAGSTLQQIIDTRQPRILNDLEQYLSAKPESDATAKIVKEGIRSSLTCPLIVDKQPVGFVFFCSSQRHRYLQQHVDFFQQIAGRLSLAVAKANMVSLLSTKRRELEDRNAELARLNELKNRFIGMAAHDLRSPISLIQMLSNFLLSESDLPEPERRQMLQDMVQTTSHMLNLINDLLDMNSIESGKLVLTCQPIDVAMFLAQTVDRHRRPATGKQIELQLEAVDAGRLQADPHRLRQVLDNLVTNAVKFSPAQTTVSMGAQLKNAQWVFTVADQGPGIRDDEMDQLFVQFAKLSALPTGGEKSTGLGLAICKHIVEAHHGRIWAKNMPNGGAQFSFALPAEPPKNM